MGVVYEYRAYGVFHQFQFTQLHFISRRLLLKLYEVVVTLANSVNFHSLVTGEPWHDTPKSLHITCDTPTWRPTTSTILILWVSVGSLCSPGCEHSESTKPFSTVQAGCEEAEGHRPSVSLPWHDEVMTCVYWLSRKPEGHLPPKRIHPRGKPRHHLLSKTRDAPVMH